MPRLHYPPVTFDGLQAMAISRGFARAVAESDYEIYACTIMPAHIHVVAKRHAHGPRLLAGHLKGRATQELTTDGRNPMTRFEKGGVVPSPWGVDAWVVYLDTFEQVYDEIAYVRNNPRREGKKEQRWSFETKFLGWTGG